MGLQGFPERPEGVAIARGGSVLGNFQDGPDLGESEFVPDFQDHDLPLFARQPFHRSGEKLLAFVRSGKTGLEVFGAIKRDGRFATSPALVAAQTIERGGADCGVKEGAIFDRMLTAPETDERFLDDVFGIGATIRPAAGEQEQGRAELGKTSLPVFISERSLHDLFTVFKIETPPNADFV
jgi:hypothetical protein